ncbi:MAG: DUF305 domain-containing protein [Litorilinea sp.]
MDSAYKKLAIMLPINAVLMFLLTYSMIDTFDHFYPNLNRAYMALIMVAPMGLVMLFFMRGMYPHPRINAGLIVGYVLVFIIAFWLARTQTFVGDEVFLRSMIPHHSSAIVMCEHATLSDPEIVTLCEEIVQAQEEEIAQMKAILERY